MNDDFAAPTDLLLGRIQGEYLEMPGLQLTLHQAQRLFGLAEHDCLDVLTRLVERKFLMRKADGRFAREQDGSRDRHRAAGLVSAA